MKKSLLLLLILLLPILAFAKTDKNKSLNQQKTVVSTSNKKKTTKVKEIKTTENKVDNKSENQEEIIIDIVNYPTN